MTLPTFFVIGAGRSGTTTIYEHLRAHPEVFMSAVKEPSYFALADRPLPAGGPAVAWWRGGVVTDRAEYERLFEGAAGFRAVGEASTRYLASPIAPARIRATIPSARLIAILRDPSERAYSSWLGLRRDGFDPAQTFEEALDDQERRRREDWALGQFLRPGFYAEHIGRCLRHFPSEQLRVHLHDDLHRDTTGLMRDIFAFVGVDPEKRVDVSLRAGATGVIRNPALGRLWAATPRTRRSLEKVVPSSVRAAARAWVMRDLERPTIAPETRRRLVALYRDDVLALQELLGRDLGAWLV